MIAQPVMKSWPALHLDKREPVPRVLVVEDSPTQARELQFLLEEAGYLAEFVHDGEGALARIHAVPPDLIVTDLIMARMSGLELIEAVRRDFPFVPIVLVTAFGSERVAAQALRAGAASYVPKRDVHEDLVPTLRGILEIALGRHSQRRALGCLTRMEACFALDNDTTLVAPLVRHLEEVLDSTCFCDPAALIRVGVALREALFNAMERGNLEIGRERFGDADPARHRLVERRLHELPYRDRRVHLTARLSATEVAYIVRDEGPGFDLSALADREEPTALSSEAGRGLHLIRAFMDEVSQDEGPNAITLVKRRRLSPACA
jgi:CheY-like chemotaxis protein